MIPTETASDGVRERLILCGLRIKNTTGIIYLSSAMQ